MCSTCGCGETNTIELKKPNGVDTKEITSIYHVDDHHHHSHEEGHAHSHHHHHADEHVISLEKDILSTNNLLAERNKGYFEAKNILTLNIVSSPGSGKTTILERTLKIMSGK